MFPVIKYNNRVYDLILKDTLYFIDWLDILTERDKDVLIVSKLIGSARYALFPDELTTEKNHMDLAAILPIIKRHGWDVLLEKPEYIEGVSTTGEDFYVYGDSNETG